MLTHTTTTDLPHESASSPKENPPVGSTRHIASIDGVRGFAIFCVVMFHESEMGEPYIVPLLKSDGLRGLIGHILSTGYSGVELFFVLSGFCLAYPFFSRPERKDDWGRYLLNRMRRIFPPYIIAFLLFSVIGRILRRLEVQPFTAANYMYEPFNVVKWFKIVTLTETTSIIGSFWTLPLEWRWYFLFPVVLVLSRKISPFLILLGSVSVSYLAQTYGNAEHFYGSFILTTTFLPLFTLGVVAASVTARYARRGREGVSPVERGIIDFAPLGAVVGLIISFFGPLAGKGLPILQLSSYWGLLYFSLIICAVHTPLINNVFSWRPIVFLGVISYSVYLVQEPIIRAIALLQYGEQNGDLRVTLTNFVLAPLLCALGGWLFHLFAERPFLKSGGGGASPQRVKEASAVSATD